MNIINREKLWDAVKRLASEECRDLISVRNIDPAFHEYNAYFNEGGSVECLGQLDEACDTCQLRVASYTVQQQNGIGVRFPEHAVGFNPVKPVKTR